jgi:hypothetical protein
MVARKKNPPRPTGRAGFIETTSAPKRAFGDYASVSIARLKVALGRMAADTFASSSL